LDHYNFRGDDFFYINVAGGDHFTCADELFGQPNPPYMKKASVKAGFRIDYIGIG